MNEKDKNIIQYANGFSVAVNPESGEVLIAFTQNQPVFDEKEKAFVNSDPREICSIVLPYGLGIQLGDIIKSAALPSQNTEEGNE